MVDDKLRILAAMKDNMGARLTTVFPSRFITRTIKRTPFYIRRPILALQCIGDSIHCDFNRLFKSFPKKFGARGSERGKSRRALGALPQPFCLSHGYGAVELVVHLMPLPPALTLPRASLGVLETNLLNLSIFLLRLFLAGFYPRPILSSVTFCCGSHWRASHGRGFPSDLPVFPRPHLPRPRLTSRLFVCPRCLVRLSSFSLQHPLFRLILIRPRLPRKKIFICQGGPKNQQRQKNQVLCQNVFMVVLLRY